MATTTPDRGAPGLHPERITRPEPERTHPVRSWSTLLPTSAAVNGGAGATLESVVSRSVELGYRVVDDDMREGQRAAQRVGERSFAADALTGEVQQLTARMTRYAQDFLEVWLQLVELATAGSASGAVCGAICSSAGRKRRLAASSAPSSSQRWSERV